MTFLLVVFPPASLLLYGNLDKTLNLLLFLFKEMPLKVILFVVATSTLFLGLSSASDFGRELFAEIKKKARIALLLYIVSRQLKAVSLALSSCVFRTYGASLIRYFTHHAFHALQISPHVKGSGLFGDTDTHYEANAFDDSHSFLKVACLSSVTLVYLIILTYLIYPKLIDPDIKYLGLNYNLMVDFLENPIEAIYMVFLPFAVLLSFSLLGCYFYMLSICLIAFILSKAFDHLSLCCTNYEIRENTKEVLIFFSVSISSYSILF